jgi:hypothetical protein
MSLGMPPGLSGGALRWQLPSHCKETQDATRLARWSFTLAATKNPAKKPRCHPACPGGASRLAATKSRKENQDATPLARWSFTLAATKKPGKEIQDATRLARWSFTLKSAKGKPLYVAPNLPSRKIAVTT